MRRALLLNADWSPLHFVSEVDAIVLFYKGTAEVIEGPDGTPAVWDDCYRSPSTSIHVPATLRLRRFIKKRWKPPRFRKRVLFNRDGWCCQYCGERLVWQTIEVEHILPSSRGGKTSWFNCVAACKPCNKAKADRTPDEAGMRLLRAPTYPTAVDFWDTQRADCWHESWNDFLPRS